MGRAMKQSTHQFHKIFFHITAEDNKERMNIPNFINIYIQIYIPLLCVMIMTQNKNDSIDSILQHGRVIDKNCCVVFPSSGFPYLILCTGQCKWRVAATYLAIRAKNN